MKVYCHVFVTYQGKVLGINTASQPDFFVPGALLLSTEPYDEFLIKHVVKATGLTVFIGKPFFLRETIAHGERTLELFLEATAGSDNVALGAGIKERKWLDLELYETEGIAEHLLPAFEAFAEKQR